MIKPPDYLALIDPVRCNSFSMRYEGRRDILHKTVIASGDKRHDAPIACLFLDDEVSARVCDAVLLVSPCLRLMSPVPLDYAADLLLCPLTLRVDGEVVINEELLERFLIRPNCDPAPTDGRVFLGRREEELVGGCRLHFLPGRSKIEMTVKNIPTGAGDLHFNAGVILANYTTLAKQGALFEVGELDERHQAFPIARTWTGADGSGLTQDRIESMHGGLIRTLLEKEGEAIRLRAEQAKRAKEDELLRKKNGIEETLLVDTGLTAEAHRQNVEKRSLDKEWAIQGGGGGSGVDLEETLSRAKRRLVTWGLFAMFLVILFGAVLIFLGHVEFLAPLRAWLLPE